MSRALILAAHGSHLNPDASTPVRAHARDLRERGTFDRVLVGSWKEEPSLARVLDACDEDDVTVVPVFISGGYFTEQVIPREMGITGPVSRIRGTTVRYTRPIGSHPALAEVVAQRAMESGAGPETGVAVLGHGTPRNPRSERNVTWQAELVAATGRFAEVTAVFLEQEPSMRSVFQRLHTESIVMVPLFVADGWHVAESIPDELALEGAELCEGGRRLRYTPAAGTHPGVVNVIAELAAEAATWC